MKIKKTPQAKRSTYIYVFANGQKVELTPSEDGITEADIKMLHAADDSEVYYNLKNLHPTRTAEERQQHGYDAPGNWNLSIDSLVNDEGDESTADRYTELSVNPFEDSESPAVERLHTILSAMPPRWQEIYCKYVIEGYSFTEIAKEYGTSKQAIDKVFTKIKARILADTELQKLFQKKF